MNTQDGTFLDSKLIKPEDAKFKLCPFITEHSKFIGKTVFNCVGPECMAWDWRKWKEIKPKTPNAKDRYVDNQLQIDDEAPKEPTHGTCALIFHMAQIKKKDK